jgi:hypothetical protein
VNESDHENFVIQGFSKNQKEYNNCLKKILQDKTMRMDFKKLYEKNKNDKKFKKGIPSSVLKPVLESIVVFGSTVSPSEEPETLFENTKKDPQLLKKTFLHEKNRKSLYKKDIDCVDFLNRDIKKCNKIMKELAGSNFYDDNNEKKVRRCFIVCKVF